MTNAKINQVKALVKETFPDFNQEEDVDITPIAIRCYLRRKLPENVLYETAVLVPSRNECWQRIENVCLYLRQLKHWYSL